MSEKQKRKRRGERADGRILVTFVIGKQPDGTPMRKFFYGNTRTEAEAKRDEYKKQLSMGFDVQNKNMTVAEWIKTWKELYSIRDEYKYYINSISRKIGNLRMKDIREAHLQAMLDANKDKSASYLTKYQMILQQIFSKALKNKVILDDPSKDLHRPGGTVGTHRALERWETECILQHWSEHRAGIWAMLMMLCGLRRSEMVALTWDNVDMERRTISINQVAVFQGNSVVIEQRAKSSAGIRVLPICNPLWEALNTVPIKSRDGYVCKSSQNGVITASAFKRGWIGFNLSMQRLLNGESAKQQGRRVSLEKRKAQALAEGKQYVTFEVRAHDLRHTFATALYDAGVPVKAAQYYLGHSDIQMTLNLYTHLSKEREHLEQSRMVNYLDNWLHDNPSLS